MTEVVTGTQQLHVVSYEAPGLGDRSYLVHDGKKAVVIDPQRDPAPYLATADELGAEIVLVLETHVHNDYVSGGLALARRARATYGVPAGEPVEFRAECEALDEGDVLPVGELALTVLSTPGHTPHHLSFLVEDASGAKVVLTGGSLLNGAVGRTDLFGADRAAELAMAQWRSVRRILNDLPPGTGVLPTHGFGSFCSRGAGTAVLSAEPTVGSERQINPAALLELEEFVRGLVTDPLPVPAYYRHMAPLNRAGATEPGMGPVAVVSPGSLPGLLGAGAAIVDIRRRRAFAHVHWRGALNIELGPSLATYLGWVVPFAAPVVVVSHSGEEVEEARHLLSGIGREELAGWAQDDFLAQIGPDHGGRYAVCGFGDLAARRRAAPIANVLDVRFPHEWRGGHISGARNVPLPEIASECSSLPGDEEIWVHCALGFRAAIAASILSAAGLRPVLVDDAFGNAAIAGLEVVMG